MTSKRKASWTTVIHGSQPRARQRLSPPSPPVLDHPVPSGSTSTQASPPTNISQAPVNASLPHKAMKQGPATDALQIALGGLRSSLNGLPPLQLAVGDLLECVVDLQVEEKNRQAFDDLAADMTRLATLLQKHVVSSNPSDVPYSIANVARAIDEQTKVIKKCQGRSKFSHLTSASDTQETVLNCYQRIGALFQQLQMDVSLSIWDAMQEELMHTRLKDLAPAHEAHYDAALPTTVTMRVGCTEGTRIGLLEDTKNWTREANAANICWLNGMAGTGKTTITFTLCKILYENSQLGGSFFCSRNSSNCRDVNKIVPTIAYQLGQYSNPYRQALCDILKGDRDIARRNINTQFEQLISKPLMQVSKAMPSDVVVVIDALDECTDVRGTKDVLEMLLRHASNLPVKFFIASRPEPTILERMTAAGGPSRSILKLHDIEKSLVRADIKLYLAEALQSVEITPAELDTLVDRAGCLFIFAATAARYIVPDRGPVDHRKRLLTVLKLGHGKENKSYKDIDKLYERILSNALDADIFEDDELVPRRQLLWTVVCAREPLTMSALAEVLQMDGDQSVQLALQPLQSLIHVSETTRVVTTLHASFPDFLLSKERADAFYCNEAQHSAYLAECCFGVMERSLRFNICGLESSYQLDSEVADLESRVDKAISAGLFYCCVYWGDHLTRSPHLPPLVSLLGSFMRRRLLFWLEVLNLKKQVSHADGVSGQALAWLPMESSTTDLHDFICDARNFIITLASTQVSDSTPHIYISALPFTSSKSRVHATYWPKLRGLIRIDNAVMQAGGTNVLATWEVKHPVHCIARSSNGKLVASGSGQMAIYGSELGTRKVVDGGVSIWDAARGACVLGPLEGHEEPIQSISISPDNTCLASGSSDHTIRIWDMSNGTTIIGPLEGHTSAVYSVAFSPNGAYLASGSGDCTIRKWNADSGAPYGEPLRGHQGPVRSVSFSPNGKHLASSSDDCTIRVWDFLTGATAQGPMAGHTDEVYSIAYSPDGTRLASGSRDRTIRVWNMSDGTPLAGPFEGHTGAVYSVSFSPDGARVASSSSDCTIRVWEASSGNLLAGPIKGHSGGINSVLFTTDGTRILSSSWDKTIRVWDARHRSSDATNPLGHSGSIWSASLSPNRTHLASGSDDFKICVWDMREGTLVAGPFRGHTSWVLSVAFSPDGARIVSGSDDCTLRTWDALTGTLLAGPIEGHTNRVKSVAFSPDGSQIASGSQDRTLRLWDSHTGKSIAEPFKHRASVTSIAFSPDGTRIASGSSLPRPSSRRPVRSTTDSSSDSSLDNSDTDDLDDNDDLGDDADTAVEPTVRMWHTTDCSAPIWASNAHTKPVLCIAFSLDGTRLVSGSSGGTIIVLDANTGVVLHGPFREHGSIHSVAFSPDGTRVASCSWDQMVRVWDVESGTTVVGPLNGHRDPVLSVAFSLDGQRIISSSFDGTIRIWDITATARASVTSSDGWPIDDDGWLTDSRSQRLFWVPSGLRRRFGVLTAFNPIVINAACTARIDDATSLGDRWGECYDASFDAASP